MCVNSAPKWLPPAMACCMLFGSILSAIGQTASERTAQSQPEFDPRALQLLQKMAETYARLPGLDQRTEFFAANVPIPPPGAPIAPNSAGNGKTGASPDAQTGSTGTVPAAPQNPAAQAQSRDAGQEGNTENPDQSNDPPGDKLRRNLRLLAVQPNHMRMEMREFDPDTAKDQISEWVSDGKTFWTYTGEKHYYTKEAAPPHLHDFVKLNHLDTGSLELLMLFGVNPFADIRDQVDVVHYLGEATVRGVTTDVVMMRAIQPTVITEARLYIGQTDHLLRRLVTESTPITKKDAPGKIGDALDALVDGRGPAPPPASTPPPQFATSEGEAPDPEPVTTTGPMKMVMTYDNIITPLARSYPGDFTFVIPDGALLYEPLQLQRGAFKQPKKQNLADLFRAANKKKKRKTRVIKG